MFVHMFVRQLVRAKHLPTKTSGLLSDMRLVITFATVLYIFSMEQQSRINRLFSMYMALRESVHIFFMTIYSFLMNVLDLNLGPLCNHLFYL